MRPTFTEPEIRILLRAALLQKSVLADRLIQLHLQERPDPTDEDGLYDQIHSVQSAIDKLTRALPRPA